MGALDAGQEGSGAANLVDRFPRLGMEDPSKDSRSLFQVMKAVEAAENIIKQQFEENKHLKSELESKTRELEKYNLNASMTVRPSHDASKDELIPEPYKPLQLVSPAGIEDDKRRWTGNRSTLDPHGNIFTHQNAVPKNENPALQTRDESELHSANNKMSGVSKGVLLGQAGEDNLGSAQFSSQSSRSLSPSGYQREGEYDPKFTLAAHGFMQMSEVNGQGNPWKQDLILKVREQEEEIVLLRRHLAEYSMKESQIRNEKYVLEKRIASMRRVFDQQQQDLIDATSKAVSYRQDIIEENIRLTYALQAAEQERSTFVSSLLPLLAEYSMQPIVSDAQSIVSNLKVLFKHLQEKLIISEEKLKESQYQLAPWPSDAVNNTYFAPQSPPPSFGATSNTSNKSGLEIVPQPAYTQLPPFLSNSQTTRIDLELGNPGLHPDLGGVASKNSDQDNLGRSSPSASRKAQDKPVRPVVAQSQPFGGERNKKPPSFKDLISSNEMEKSDASGLQNTREPSTHWGTRNSAYSTSTPDDPNSYSPYLPPVLEEPSSSFSEAAEDDPLPAIEGLQITGDAFPGRELQASGYSINGTTSCNFEWVRYFEDGSVNYIVGAKQPNYLVTADDVDFVLAIEVQPLDDRKRKGELVNVFANEHKKITCDPEMQERIEKTLSIGHASFEVSLSAGCLDIWEPAVLAIKREGYSIKCNGPRGVVVTEKFSQSTAVTIPYGQATEFSILSSTGTEYLLRTTDSSPLRDTIVLTLRLFNMRAGEKRKGKKKGLFFNK